VPTEAKAHLPTVDDGGKGGALQAAGAQPLAMRVSRALAEASVLARNERLVVGVGRGLKGRADEKTFRLIERTLVAVFFVLPMLFAAIYLTFIARDQYYVETRFSVRATKNVTSDLLSAFTGSADGLSRQAIGMIATYIRSEALVRDLEGSIGITALYAAPRGDFLSRFDPLKPIEDFHRYFWWKLSVNEEVSAGTLSIGVKAFSAADALQIAQAILDRSETMILSLSEKNRQSILDTSQKRLARAQERLLETTAKMGALRGASGVLDGDVETKAQVQLIYELELALSRLVAIRDTQSRQLAPNSAPIRNLDAQIAGVRAEIDQHRARLTQRRGRLEAPLSNVLTDFEAAKVENEIARREYVVSAAAVEEARTEAARNELYMSVFVRPQQPESAIYPKRALLFIGTLLTCLLLTWVMLSFARTARIHRAR
jgi:capsular polysaccharide transport system permease protein